MPKILIVDDDITITELMKALVKTEGHEPTTVNDSLQAMEIARSVNPDLITLDLMMPGLTGFELCKLLHDDPSFANTPIVIVSAKDDSESKEQAKEAGATDYLTKPFGLEEFINKIKPFVTKISGQQTVTN
ncbi:MAG: response regulator [Chloroflexota bacterium]